MKNVKMTLKHNEYLSELDSQHLILISIVILNQEYLSG